MSQPALRCTFLTRAFLDWHIDRLYSHRHIVVALQVLSAKRQQFQPLPILLGLPTLNPQSVSSQFKLQTHSALQRESVQYQAGVGGEADATHCPFDAWHSRDWRCGAGCHLGGAKGGEEMCRCGFAWICQLLGSRVCQTDCCLAAVHKTISLSSWCCRGYTDTLSSDTFSWFSFFSWFWHPISWKKHSTQSCCSRDLEVVWTWQEVLVDGLRRELAANIEAMLAKQSFDNLEVRCVHWCSWADN